ncbi:outer membrane lipid asymmetry maintenance protein MlaD [Thioalkalivibrio sulfidiphilus]|uniref:outer membrane lipid asymmetry maintenance protein MlaD n=1 Tax=Thioalkalivibrio sulfidiphilus TaxID=1033854 RepID=UPI003B305BD8
MTTRTIEIAVGIFVALGLAGLFMLAMQVSNISEYRNTDGYTVSAYFTNIGGLKVRAPVTVSGVRVGRVTAIRYDPERFQARVEMTISAAHDYLPADTQASIYTAGLLGEQYIALEPGGEDDVLVDGSEIYYTQSALVLEEIIGRILVNLTTN